MGDDGEGLLSDELRAQLGGGDVLMLKKSGKKAKGGDGGETLGEPFSTPCYSGFAKVRVFDDISGDVDVGKPMQTQVRVALDETLLVKCRGDRRVRVCILEEIRVGLVTGGPDHLPRVEGVALIRLVFLQHIVEFNYPFIQVYFDVAEGLPESGDLIVSLRDAGQDVRPSLADDDLLLGVFRGNI